MSDASAEVRATLPAGVTEPIPGALLRLALPVLASQALRIAYQWVDALWVRGLGVDATAAVTTSVFVMWAVLALNDIFGIGVIAFVSQLLGAGERRRAGVAAFKGLRASALLGLAGTAAAASGGARAIYELMRATPGVAASGEHYLAIVLGASPLPMVAITAESIMRAAGDTRTPLLINLCSVALNAALAPLLIYGWGPFPALGVRGAALATVAAQATLVAGYLWMAARGHRALPLARGAPGPPVRIAGMARVGVPAALIGVLFAVVYVAFVRVASHFGAAAMALVGIVNRVEGLVYLTSVAIGTAGAALVGQNLGAGRPERAAAAIRTGLRWNLWLSLAITVLIAAFPRFFLGLFTRDPEVHRVGVAYLRVIAGCLLFSGMEMVTAEAIMGSGHTTAVSWIFTVISLLRIPLAYWFPAWTRTGVIGIAWVISLTCTARCLMILGWTARGTWKRGLHGELYGPPPIEPGAAS